MLYYRLLVVVAIVVVSGTVAAVIVLILIFALLHNNLYNQTKTRGKDNLAYSISCIEWIVDECSCSAQRMSKNMRVSLQYKLKSI